VSQESVIPVVKPQQSAMPVQSLRLTPPSMVARNSMLSLCSELWTLVLVFLTMPVLIRTLGPDSFGLFSLAWVVLGYMVILDLGVSRAATKFISEHLSRDQIDSVERVCRTAITWNLVLGIAGGVVVFVLTPWLTSRIFHLSTELESQAQAIFFALAISLPILLTQAVIRAILSSYQKFGWISSLNALAVTLQWGGACIMALLGFQVVEIVIVCVATRALITAGYGIVLARIDRKFLGLNFSNLDEELLRLLRFGGWVMISQLLTPILLYLDRILVASLISLEAMTFYVIPYEVITRLRIIPASLVNALFPSLSERSTAPSSELLVRLYSESLKYMVLILLPCFLVLAFLGPDILAAWVGPEYASRGGQVLRIMAGGALLNSLSYVPYAALLALGRPDLPAKFHLAELPLYLSLSVLFIPRWGIAGAAWAVTIRLAGDAVALFWATSQNLPGTGMLQTSGRPLVLNLLLGLVFILIKRWPVAASAQLAEVAACVVCYALAAWFLVLERSERPLLVRALQARGRPV
jgi:O-antigen/teichoic acid export membrane protein